MPGFDLRRPLNSIPVIGSLGASIWGDPDQEAHEEAMKKASALAAQSRPEMMNSRMNAIGQMSQAFEPMNRMMQATYGGNQPAGPTGGMMDIGAMAKNPMSQGLQDQMYQSAFGRQAPPGAPPPGFANGQNPQAGNSAFGLPPLGQRRR